MTETFHLEVSATDHKKRLDEFLFATFPKISRLYLREVVRDARCVVNGSHENRGYVLRRNDFVEIELDLSRNAVIEPDELPLEILFEDELLLVVNKPAGMLIHPTVGVRRGTLLNALAHHLNGAAGDDDASVRAGLVHRLDKDTSGLVVVAKTMRSHRILASHFQRKLVEKRYIAVLDGIVTDDFGSIDAPIGRFEEERVWNVKPDGKASLSRYETLTRANGRTLVRLEPVTGRTNQLRIHCAHIGHPIAGDVKYGGSEFPRLCLHAFKLNFWHPDGGRRLEFELPVPPDFLTE